MKRQPPSYETQELREFAEVLRGRRTIELFLQTPIPDELVDAAIATAVWAPNHHVSEPWHFYRLGDATRERCLDLCRELVTVRKDAEAGDFKRKRWSEKPGWLVLTCKRSADEILQKEDYAACSAAAQNFMLYLWKAGIGSKWTSGEITRDERFHEIVGIDAAKEFVVGLFWYGYAKFTPTQSRKDRVDVTTTTA